jgi:hypothetical protein
MVMHEPRYSNDEFARRGNDLYEKKIRVQVEDGNEGKVVAIDIDSGQFEVAQDALTASWQSARTRRPGSFVSAIRRSTASARGILRSGRDRWHRQHKL